MEVPIPWFLVHTIHWMNFCLLQDFLLSETKLSILFWRQITSIFHPLFWGQMCYFTVVVKLPSCVWLFVTPWTVACQAAQSMGFFRQEDWSGLPCCPPVDLPDPGIKPPSLASPALGGRFLPLSPQGSRVILLGENRGKALHCQTLEVNKVVMGYW